MKLKIILFVILDYAHTPDALKIMFKNLKDQFKDKKFQLYLDVEEIEINLKDLIMGKIANNYCDKIYLTDDNPRTENPKK